MDQKQYLFEDNSGRHLKAQVGTTLRVTEVKVLEVGEQAKSARPVDNSPLLFHRSLADLIGSGVVYALQDILDHYIPLVGNENRDALVKLVRQEANEYLDQELIQSPFPQLSSKSCDRPLSTRVTTELLSVDLHL